MGIQKVEQRNTSLEQRISLYNLHERILKNVNKVKY